MRFTHLALVLVFLPGLAPLLAAPEANAAEAAPGCLGLGVGLLNPYFDLPWSSGEKAKFAGLIRQPSVAAYWGVERQNETGEATTRFGAQGGIDVGASGTAAAIFQPVQAPRLVPGFSYVLIDVLARVFVKRGILAIALSEGPASYAVAAYPRSPFRTTVEGQWTTIGEQLVLGTNTPVFDRVSILSLTPSAEFSIGCVTFITHERNIGLPEATPLTKGAMASPLAAEPAMAAALGDTPAERDHAGEN